MHVGRTLVDGYLERISVSAFEKYRLEITRLVRSAHGVYALYHGDRLYYVGLARDLRVRVGQHLRDHHAGRWDRFSLYLVRKVDHIKEIEALLLRIAEPRGNKVRGRLRRAANLEEQLRRMVLDRQQAELSEMFGRSSRPVGRRSDARKKVRPARGSPTKKQGRTKSRTPPLKGVLGHCLIFATYQGRRYTARVYRSGRISFQGRLYETPSGAAVAARGKSTNGWTFWSVRKDGKLVKLADLRRASPRNP